MSPPAGTTPGCLTDLLVLGLATSPAATAATQAAQPPVPVQAGPTTATRASEAVPAISSAREANASSPTFVNPIYEGADPWIIRRNGEYFLCQSEGNQGISICRSRRLTDKGSKRIVWRAPARGWNSGQVWAPELHCLDGKWYIYYAASDGRNANHRMGVLQAAGDDPCGAYIDKGMLYTGDDFVGRTANRWAIDGTPLQVDGRLYLVWSGWAGKEDVQHLYIAPMSNPWTMAGKRVRLCGNADYTWERVGEKPRERGLSEGPQVLRRNGRIFIIYSCSSSWDPTYKLGMIYTHEGANPLSPNSWKKHPHPVFAGSGKVHGVGHASFTTSPDETEDWIVYHTKISPRPGWQRAVCIQKFGWTPEGMPDFGRPTPLGTPIVAPSGEAPNKTGGTFADSFDEQHSDRWVYYGYERYLEVKDRSLSIGGDPEWGLVNQYRCGEKALVRGKEWANFSLNVRLRFEEGEREAGVLFRVQQPSIGYQSHKGYFAGLVRGTNVAVLGRMDGGTWTELARAAAPVLANNWQDLRIEAVGDQIHFYVDGELKITACDGHYRNGMAGVRVVDTHAHFDEFRIVPR